MRDFPALDRHAVHMRKVNTLIGTPVERVEDLRFLRGKGQYVDDLAPEGLLHAVMLRSAVAHGRIRSVEAAAARKLKGVVGVVTAEEIAIALGRVPKIPLRLEVMPAFVPYEQPVIADGKVRYVGEPVAVVLADSAAIAEDALDAIRRRYRAAAGRRGPRDRRATARSSLRGERQQPRRPPSPPTKGDAEAAFRDAPYTCGASGSACSATPR